MQIHDLAVHHGSIDIPAIENITGTAGGGQRAGQSGAVAFIVRQPVSCRHIGCSVAGLAQIVIQPARFRKDRIEVERRKSAVRLLHSNIIPCPSGSNFRIIILRKADRLLNFISVVIQCRVIMNGDGITACREICCFPSGKNLMRRVRTGSFNIADADHGRITLPEHHQAAGQQIAAKAAVSFLVAHMEVYKIEILIHRNQIDVRCCRFVQRPCAGRVSDAPADAVPRLERSVFS